MISKERAFIIDVALKIEKNLSIILSNVLVINDIDQSKTLGNKSSSLSFNTKADILLDSDYISSENRKKFQLFMEIRNQFAHNKSCDSFLQCVKLVNDCEKRLDKYYPIQGLDKQSKLKQQFENLIVDLNSIVNDCHKKYIENLEDFVKSEFQGQAFEELKSSLIKNITQLDKLIDFSISQENLNKLKETLIERIVNESIENLGQRKKELETKVIKRKLKELE
jgi:hypothetical protein